MADWIKDERRKIEIDEAESVRRAQNTQEISRQGARYWEELTLLIQRDIRLLNADEKIKEMIGFALEYSDESIGSFKVVKISFPAVRLHVSRRDEKIEVKRTITELLNPDTCARENYQRTRTREEREELKLFIGEEGELLLRNKAQRIFQPDQLSEYLLKPLLVPHTVVNNMPY